MDRYNSNNRFDETQPSEYDTNKYINDDNYGTETPEEAQDFVGSNDIDDDVDMKNFDDADNINVPSFKETNASTTSSSKIPKVSSPKNSFLGDIVETVKDTTSGIQKSAKEMTNKISDGMSDFDKHPNKMLVIGGLLFVLLVCVIVAYGLYSFISVSVFNQSKIVFEKTKIPVLCNKYSKFDITNFNTTGNGKRRSYTFWMYIHDLNKYNGSYKHVFHIGDSGDIRRASPYVFLDSTENKLYFRFGALENDTFTKSYASVQNLSVSELHEFMQQGIVIPYIPLQRWVHVAVVVNENSNGGSIVAYVDGDISKITSSGDLTSNGKVVQISNLNLDKMGTLEVGGSFESSLGPGFSGLISKVSTYNYDLNSKDIYADYNQGPLNGVLSKLGLGNYGLRSPIYEIS
jgi:hypothetical protein